MDLTSRGSLIWLAGLSAAFAGMLYWFERLKPGQVVANRKTGIYHDQRCRFGKAIRLGRKIYNSAQDAETAGFKLCGFCRAGDFDCVGVAPTTVSSGS